MQQKLQNGAGSRDVVNDNGALGLAIGIVHLMTKRRPQRISFSTSTGSEKDASQAGSVLFLTQCLGPKSEKSEAKAPSSEPYRNVIGAGLPS